MGYVLDTFHRRVLLGDDEQMIIVTHYFAGTFVVANGHTFRHIFDKSATFCLYPGAYSFLCVCECMCVSVCVCVWVWMCACVRYFRLHRTYLGENKKYKNVSLYILTFAIERHHRHYSLREFWPWHTFSRSNIWNANILETARASAKNPSLIDSLLFAIEWHHCKNCTELPIFQG